ncbi:uncharacterized protein LOC114543216 [Dendronephthya gigantea]|uniref:uncharacterized protein LOC114543216 n=1 Tax=Dendronephthya gigantea TaxID=151771 RepID=UPI00106BE795|nr:uncharacterized protein LOC114543216 [Dendronephthya gigantea]
MEGRMAFKRPHDGNPSLNYDDRFHYNIYRQTQPFTAAASRRKNFADDLKVPEVPNERNGSSFSGSLAEVYEKALNNVLNIQPNFKMDEGHSDRKETTEKKPLSALDTLQYQPPGGCKFPHSETNTLQRVSDDKKLNPTNKSAFHVPEKRRVPTSQSRYGNWSHEHPFPYPVNYPGEYYPIVHRPPFYPQYDNFYLERLNYYPEPRRRDFPIFTHVLPWLQFERDHKPITSSPTKPMTSSRFAHLPAEGNLGYNTIKDTKNVTQLTFGTKSLARDDKTAEQKQSENAGAENHEDLRVRGGEKCAKSPDFLNVKTRRMRAFEKRNDFNNTSRKGTFGSPKEEFLFSLGLTRVDHNG